MKKADIGLIGLAVMGENLVVNMESKGFTVAVFNRTTEKVDKFVNGRAAEKNIIGCHSLKELVNSLEKPRKVFMMVKAGQAVDDMIEKLLPLLDDGDILIDGGNSHFPDTLHWHRRVRRRRRRTERPQHDARRQPRRVAVCEAHFPVHLREGRGRLSVLRLGRRKRCGALCQDGAQRH
mgnify:CR=1 FL=1